MGVFTPDFAAVDAGFPMYDKGMYRVRVTSREPSIWEKDGDSPGSKVQVSRIRFKLEMVGRLDEDGEPQSEDASGKAIIGKPVQAMDVYLHSQGSWSVAKSFVMAALGFNKSEENDFNAFAQENTDGFAFSGDPDDPAETLEENLGFLWDHMIDREVDVYLQKVTEVYNDVERENQKMSAWQPVGDRVEL